MFVSVMAGSENVYASLAHVRASTPESETSTVDVAKARVAEIFSPRTDLVPE